MTAASEGKAESHRMVTRSKSGTLNRPTLAGIVYAQASRRKRTPNTHASGGGPVSGGFRSVSAPSNIPFSMPLDPQLMTEDETMDAEGEYDVDGEENLQQQQQSGMVSPLEQEQGFSGPMAMESIIYTASAPPPSPPPGGSSQTAYTFIGPANLTTSRPYKSRIALPVPVPNLTKKSRGRRVPTAVSGAKLVEPHGVQKPQRLYRCSVENCGKCFSRGEHLKRHIRSIHTYDKPFPCTQLGCDKYFSRHDNLLQHQKVHKMNGEDTESSAQLPAKHTRQKQTTWRQQGPLMTVPLESPTMPPPMQTTLRPPVFRAISIPYYHSGPAEPVNSSVNLAVSSLRTQVDSPPRTFQALPLVDAHTSI